MFEPETIFLAGLSIATLIQTGLIIKKTETIKHIEKKVNLILKSLNIDYPCLDEIPLKSIALVQIEKKNEFIQEIQKTTGCTKAQAENAYNRLLSKKISE